MFVSTQMYVIIQTYLSRQKNKWTHKQMLPHIISFAEAIIHNHCICATEDDGSIDESAYQSLCKFHDSV